MKAPDIHSTGSLLRRGGWYGQDRVAARVQWGSRLGASGVDIVLLVQDDKRGTFAGTIVNLSRPQALTLAEDIMRGLRTVDES